MDDPTDVQDSGEPKSPPGHADLVSKIYVLAGVPAIILFIVGLFALTRWFGIPA